MQPQGIDNFAGQLSMQRMLGQERSVSMSPDQLGQKFAVSSEKFRTKISRISPVFVPNLAPNFAPNFPDFLSSFRALFRGKQRPEKIHKKIPPFFSVKSPGEFEETFPQELSGEQAI